MKTCCLCGREGSKQFRRHVQRMGYVDVPLWKCSNTAQCSMRNADDVTNDGLARAIETRLATWLEVKAA